MEFVLHIYIYGTTWSREYFDDKHSLNSLSEFWRLHKDVVSHLTILKLGCYCCTITNYEDFKFALDKNFEV